jgi:hypothetical protein
VVHIEGVHFSLGVTPGRKPKLSSFPVFEHVETSKMYETASAQNVTTSIQDGCLADLSCVKIKPNRNKIKQRF